ncbi:MAG: lysine--tRNA ligase [Xanthomonadales bacterium]|nr:lysine--tRNA ligase [Gammaproteobacteria bacterium]MBT8056749.1 lysine--tRNA ligase [Gammaproteobacteria bacterium]NNJ78796.1 lysine--tRNA ligase [Xanthomonadales bacterium]NNL05957.1 lysine--tRNA ligase [Xanthomonadales bacterium]
MTEHKDPSAGNEADENRLIAERRAKLSEWRDAGQAYPNDFCQTTNSSELHTRFCDALAEELEQVDETFSVAGRIMAKRVMGKIAFVRLQDRGGSIQLMLQRDNLPEGVFQHFKHWDVGDIVGAVGRIVRTQKGELSIRAEELRLLSKSLRPLPEKYHGLTDTEVRYRQRYLDLIMSEESREVFRTRSKIITFIRSFMEGPCREFLEVETPMMHPIPGGATARPFVTHHNALDLTMYLRVAPELYLKRLIVGGMGRVYEINRNFRNEGVSTRHNPEFTMLEFYWAFANYEDLMKLTESMLSEMAMAVAGSSTLVYQGLEIDFSGPYERLSVEQAVRRYNPDLADADLWNASFLRATCETMEIHTEDGWGSGRLLMELFEATVEEQLVQPTFVTQYPTEVSPLSRRNDDNPDVTDRFELFICGREIANGFSELNDPEDQAERFRAQVAEKDAGDLEAMHYDADYIRALEFGMPPTAGEGIGIDRLVMLFTDSPSIRDVLLFPYMRPEG